MKIRNFTMLALAMLLVNLSLVSQSSRNCGAMENLEFRKMNDDKIEKTMINIEKQTRSFIENSDQLVTGIVTIPTVVHVIYSNSNENISDAQILSQINVLNEDFRRLNSDADGTWSQAADTEIEFCLASVDPNGNSTTGITRKSSNTTSWGTNDAMKFASNGGVNAWPTGDYLNIWVCNIGGGILGYAQFPGGSTSTDGVVVGPNYFGSTGYLSAPFDLGRTTTHEVGHWLNLRHIWGDGGCNVDDFVSDTPTSDASNGGCAVGHVSCGSVDMVQNYMDYSDDACMNLYTQGQKTRMRAVFDGFRSSLLNSGGCGNAPTPTCNDGVQNGNETGIDCGGSCAPCSSGCSGTEVVISITLDNYPEETSWTIKNSNGSTVATGGTYGNQADGSTVTINECLSDGCYDFTINDTYGDGICCSYGNGSYSVTAGGSVVASGGNFTNSETTNFCIGGGPAPTCNDGVQNGDEEGVDCGGSCTPCNTGGGCSTIQIDFENFESGWGIWNDGGSDCYRNNYAPYASSGSYTIRIRDNSGNASSMTTDNLGLSGFEEVTIDFNYYPVGMENGEDFWLQGSLDGGNTWTTVATWARGTDFQNGNAYSESIIITGGYTNTTKWRFRCDASVNNDRIYIDDVNISGCANGSRSDELADGHLDGTLEVIAQESEELSISENSIQLYPNPTRDILNVSFDVLEDSAVALRVIDAYGKQIEQNNMQLARGKYQHIVDASAYNTGFYFVQIKTGDKIVTKKFIVAN
jgi:hypothetical protein